LGEGGHREKFGEETISVPSSLFDGRPMGMCQAKSSARYPERISKDDGKAKNGHGQGGGRGVKKSPRDERSRA
jgi:hypothetical protein